VGAVESMAIYGLYKVTMDLAVFYELKSEFADASLERKIVRPHTGNTKI
jgi:hypothetical protein